MKGTLIGLSGRARVGKGTFVKLLTKKFLRDVDSDSFVYEFAFADALKHELDPILRQEFGISAWTTDAEEKKIIRPKLVERGAGARKEDPDHWIKQIQGDVQKHLNLGAVVVVSDCRYSNECKWIKSLGGTVVYIERIREDGTPVPPANSEEAKNDPEARECADIIISWPTTIVDNLIPHVDNVCRLIGLGQK